MGRGVGGSALGSGEWEEEVAYLSRVRDRFLATPARHKARRASLGVTMLFWWPCTYDTALEFTLMSQAGMNYQQILASLTTNPAWKFRCSDHGGRIAKGMDGDLVVLGADPAENVSAFSKVRFTIRAGKIIYAQR